jgi:hypothetical protein
MPVLPDRVGSVLYPVAHGTISAVSLRSHP